VLDRLRTLIHAPHVEARAHEEDEVPPRAAAGVEHFHAADDTAAKQLIEQVDVDVAKLFAQACRRLHHAGVARSFVQSANFFTKKRSPSERPRPR
jgi:hypothetical protein